MPRFARAPLWSYGAVCLLMLVWVCANRPQILASHVVAWMDGAKHFSPHQHLRFEVLAILAGTKTSSPTGRAQSCDSPPLTAPLPMTIAQATVRQVDLSFITEIGANSSAVLRAESSLGRFTLRQIPAVSPLREPLAEPPRRGLSARASFFMTRMDGVHTPTRGARHL